MTLTARVTGTVGGNRDGSEFHGVAGVPTSSSATPVLPTTTTTALQDSKYFYTAWNNLADAITEANKKAGNPDRGGVINNSWGTNTRVEDQKDTAGHDGYNTGVHLNVNSAAETDYEFMLFAKRYGFDSTAGSDVSPNGHAETGSIMDDKSFV
ncbi:MAG: hypothetical protein ACLT0O_08730 [Sutterella wadsworthensis]